MQHYAFKRTLRETLFGKVTLAQCKESKEYVAVKLSNKQKYQSKINRSVENPKEECKILRRLSKLDLENANNNDGQEHIIKVVGEGEGKVYSWTAMEYASEGELFDIIQEQGAFNVAQAQSLFRQLARGVRYMHRRGVVHRDLSLENLLLHDINFAERMRLQDKKREEEERRSKYQKRQYTNRRANIQDTINKNKKNKLDFDNCVLKICDFGVAKSGSNEADFIFTDRKSQPGKVRYMAPETFSGLTYDGRKADVWSMGVIAFTLLAGCMPFTVPCKTDARFRYIMQGKVDNLLERWGLADRVPPAAMDLLKHLLCPEGNRFSIDEVCAHPWVNIEPLKEEEEEEVEDIQTGSATWSSEENKTRTIISCSSSSPTSSDTDALDNITNYLENLDNDDDMLTSCASRSSSVSSTSSMDTESPSSSSSSSSSPSSSSAATTLASSSRPSLEEIIVHKHDEVLVDIVPSPQSSSSPSPPEPGIVQRMLVDCDLDLNKCGVSSSSAPSSSSPSSSSSGLSCGVGTCGTSSSSPSSFLPLRDRIELLQEVDYCRDISCIDISDVEQQHQQIINLTTDHLERGKRRRGLSDRIANKFNSMINSFCSMFSCDEDSAIPDTSSSLLPRTTTSTSTSTSTATTTTRGLTLSSSTSTFLSSPTLIPTI